MIIDARTVPPGTIIETEVCIVGAGAAGITLAREFIDAPFRVALLESGGMEFDPDTQELYEGQSIGLPFDDLTAVPAPLFRRHDQPLGRLLPAARSDRFRAAR